MPNNETHPPMSGGEVRRFYQRTEAGRIVLTIHGPEPGDESETIDITHDVARLRATLAARDAEIAALKLAVEVARTEEREWCAAILEVDAAKMEATKAAATGLALILEAQKIRALPASQQATTTEGANDARPV